MDGVVYVYAAIGGAVIDQDVIGDVGAASTGGRRRYMWNRIRQDSTIRAGFMGRVKERAVTSDTEVLIMIQVTSAVMRSNTTLPDAHGGSAQSYEIEKDQFRAGEQNTVDGTPEIGIQGAYSNAKSQ